MADYLGVIFYTLGAVSINISHEQKILLPET
jgi:hypothetical protein